MDSTSTRRMARSRSCAAAQSPPSATSSRLRASGRWARPSGALVVITLFGAVGCAPAVGNGTDGGAAGSGGNGSGGASSTGGSLGTGGGGSGGMSAGSGGSSTGGSASGGSSSGGASTGGAMATGGTGTGGRSGAGTGGSAGISGAAGTGGPSLCTPGKYLLCEDFEATAVGALPTGWTKHGAVAVASDQAARGMHSLKVSPQESGERRAYADASRLGSGHWGRIFYRVQLPAPVSCDTNNVLHSTFIGLQGVGPTRGAEEVRVVDTVENLQGMHQWLYNVQPSGSEFGKGSPYRWKYDGQWHCAEWHIDNPTQNYHFYLDGVEVTEIAINNGAGNYNGSDIPPSFTQLKAGLWNYQKACSPFLTVWIDEIAADTNRVGCAN